jgi:hypothetical protein
MRAPTSPPPSTSTAACPACGAAFDLPATGRCHTCGVDLTHPAVDELLELAERWRDLAARRTELLGALVDTRLAPPPPPAWPTPALDAPAPPPTSDVPVWERTTARVARTPDAPPTRTPSRQQPRVTAATVLAIAGVALLTTAAVVFTAVTWTTLPAWGQALVLLAATVTAGGTALLLARRGIPTAAAAVGVVTMSFAAVDVVGLDRTGSVDLGVAVAPLAAGVAALVGWWIARRGLAWVSTVGASAAAFAAASATAALADRYALGLLATALVGIGCATLLGGTVVAWRTEPARLVAGGGAAFGLTVAGVAAAVALGAVETSLPVGLAVMALAGAPLLVAARRLPLTLAPVTLLGTAALVSSARYLGAEDPVLLTTLAGATTAAAWLAPALRAEHRLPVLVGATPALAGVTAGVLAAVGTAGARWVTTVLDTPTDVLGPWAAATVTLAAAGLLSLTLVRQRTAWVLVSLVAVVSAVLPIAAAWPVLTGLALATAATVVPTPRWPRPDLFVPLLLGLLAVGWAAGDRRSLAAAAAATAAAAVLVARRTEIAPGGDPIRLVATQVTGLGAAGLAVWATAEAIGVGDDLARGLALGILFALVVGLPTLRSGRPPIGASLVLVPASVLLPGVATSPRAAGALSLLAAAGWYALAVVGWRYARWVGAVAVSAGTAALLVDVEVTLVEAYTLVPTIALTVAGLWALHEDRALRTLPALGPALVVALAPSLTVLAREPQALVRTLGLVGLAGLLALAGTRLRWLAPVVSAACAAVVVALTQLSMVVDVVPRWATTALVGVLLVYLAATYERQRLRARSTVERLRDLR